MLAGKRRFVLLAVLWSLVFLVLGGGLNIALTSMKAGPARAATPRPSIAVATVKAQRQVFVEHLVGYGRARPTTISDVAAGVAGDVTWRSPQLEAGSFVVQGAELVRIDDRDLKTAEQAARARLEQARLIVKQKEISKRLLSQREEIAVSELQISEQSYARHEKLHQEGRLSEYDFEQIRFEHKRRRRALLEVGQQKELADPELQQAVAEVAAAEAALSDAETNLERAVVQAPFSGFIDERMVHLGGRVSVGTQLFRMIDVSQIEVPIALPAAQYRVVQPGSPAQIRSAEGGPVLWKGQVARISPTIDDEDRTFFAYLAISSSQQRPVVPSGAFVTAEIDGTKHEDVIVVPRTAVVGDRVYVATRLDQKTGVAEIEGRTPVIRRRLTDMVLLESGVDPNERMVVSNVEKIAHGSRGVVILNP